MARGRWAGLWLLCAAPAYAAPWGVDGLTVLGADGVESDARMQRVALHWDLQQRWWQGERWALDAHMELAFGQWDHPQRPRAGADVGLTPVLRLVRPGAHPLYFETAIGAHVLSDPGIGGIDLSSAFQFGDFAGIGMRFGRQGRSEVGYRFMHFSNAGIKRPNPGIDFHMVRLGYWF